MTLVTPPNPRLDHQGHSLAGREEQRVGLPLSANVPETAENADQGMDCGFGPDGRRGCRSCTLCHGVGWILDCNDLGKPGPRMLELIACPIPDCSVSGQEVQSVQMKGIEFDRAAQHPRTGRIMAVHR